MTYARPLELIRDLGSDRTQTVVEREFSFRVGRGWWMWIRLDSYIHIPFQVFGELRHEDETRTIDSVAAPRLAVMGGRQHEVLLETIATHDFGRSDALIQRMEDGREDTHVAPIDLQAKVVGDWTVRIVFELAPSGLPRMRIREPDWRPNLEERNWDALCARHEPMSPFLASLSFEVHFVGAPGALDAT